MANLQTPFPLEPTREYARAELVNMLDMTVDDKLLVIDSKLTGILGLIADSATLAVSHALPTLIARGSSSTPCSCLACPRAPNPPPLSPLVPPLRVLFPDAAAAC
jgi:hypothetical protein